jgi:hypothetical protein
MTDASDADASLQSRWTVDSIAGVAFVTLVIENPTPVDRHVRVFNRLDGPVLPPRRRGVPERGWGDAGFEGVVPAEGERSLGYACPGGVERPPVEVESDGRPRDAEEATPLAAVRRLGDATPPADAIPGPGADSIAPSTDDPRVDDDYPAAAADSPVRDSSTGDSSTGDASAGDRSAADDVPAPVASWFEAVERRLDRGERLADASVPEATAVLGEAGGLDAVEDLPERLAADAAALRATAERATELAARTERVDVPIEALRRLA